MEQIAPHKLTLEEIVSGLLKDGLISEENAEHLLFQQRMGSQLNIHPLILVADQDWRDARDPKITLTLERLTEWLAQHSNLPYFRIDPLKIDVTSVTSVMSSAYATRYKILPIKVEEDHVIIATAEPYYNTWQDALKHTARTKINLVITNPADINRYLDEFYGVSRSIQRATSDKENLKLSGITNLEQLVELGRAGKLDANDQHIVHIVDWLLQYAFEQRASDIHLEPRRDQSNIRFRIDGVLHLVNTLPTPVMGAVTSRIKALGRMDVVEKRRPQDGRVKTKTPNCNEVELRLSTMPTAFGEKLVMRIFDPDVLVRGFEELGFSNTDVQRWSQWVHRPHGIILVTGPTGSGKTTTLYSTLKQLAQPEVNVCTVEDPIEMVSGEFNQMQVQHNIGLDFASGIRTLLRQDPDIIMIGEIRDLETAEMAIQCALTGHLVLSTLHTNDAASAVTRLMDIGVPPFMISATVIGIMAQRLVRTLCPHCKKETFMDNPQWETLVTPWRYAIPEKSYLPAGCSECRNTGYFGRIGLYEMLDLSPEVRAIIQPDTDIAQLRILGYKQGMEPLRISGARKIHSGTTTLDEVLKVAPNLESY